MSRPQYPSGTRVCLYLRRSDEKQDESLDTQRQNAQLYCEQRGWVIAAEYCDDAVSRAEFVRRKALPAMLRDADASSPSKRDAAQRHWEVVVCRDSSRLGGDMLRVTRLLQDLRDASVGVVYYVSDELVQIDTTTDRLLATVRGFADELERDKISSRTAEALATRVRDGRAARSAWYGYRIVNGRYEIEPREAKIVQRIYDLYIEGIGCRAIASCLNAEHVAAPQTAGKRRALGLWSRPCVRSILMRESYTGTAKHGREQRVYRGGTRIRVQRPADQVVEYEIPPIVTSEQWDRVRARFASNPSFGNGKAIRGASSKYFLVGRVRCASCGGPIFGLSRSAKRPPVYVCGKRRNNGNALCSNAMAHDVEKADASVIAELVRLLTPAVIEATLATVRTQLVDRLRSEPSERVEIEKEIADQKRRLKRLTAALEATDYAASVVDAIRDRQAHLQVLEGRLAAASTAATAVDEVDRLLAQAREMVLARDLSTDEAKRLLALAAPSGSLHMDASGIVGQLHLGKVLEDAGSGSSGSSGGSGGAGEGLPDCDHHRSVVDTVWVPVALILKAA